MLRLHILGGFSASDESGAILTIPRHRWALLALVAAAGERGIARERVLAYLWPEVPEEKARARLQQMLHAMRQSLNTGLFRPGDPLRFDDAVISSDVAAFRASIEAGDFERAVSLNRGPFLDGFHLGHAPEFDEWLESERRALAGQWSGGVERLAIAAEARGDPVTAARWWRALATADPFSSRVARHLMEALVASGDPAGALRHAATHADLVRSELGIEPDGTILQFAETLAARSSAYSSTMSQPGLPLQNPRIVATLGGEGAAPPLRKAPITEADPSFSPTAFAGDTFRAPHRIRRLVAFALGAGVIGGGVWLLGGRESLPNTIVVAPFDVFDASLELWRNGLVDVLSRNLDGAGPLRAVSPSVAIARWRGRADSTSARALADKAGAQLVVYGSLLPSGRDSALSRASLLDVRRGLVVGEVEYREALDRMDRVADSLSARLLRRLNESRGLGLPRMASLGSGNPAAIKAYLKAAAFTRALLVDSALAYSNRALEADSAFALAYLSRAYVKWDMGAGNLDSAAAADLFRAAAFNRGLSRRDSLLIQTDSLFAALSLGRLTQSHAGRLFTLAQASARQYPNDPQIEYTLGEAWYHVGYMYRITESRAGAVNAFRLAVAADSNWIAPYYHLTLLLVDANDTAQLAATIDALSKHTPSIDPELALVHQILRQGRVDPALADSFVRMRNTSLPGVILKVLADTGEIGLQLLRRRYESRRDVPMSPTDSFVANTHLASALLRRGHWREALRLPLTVGRHIVEPTVLPLAPADTARILLQRVVTRPPDRRLAMMLPWLARNRDTLVIDSLLRDISIDPPPLAKPRVIAQVRFFKAVAPAFRLLAAGDSISAARVLEALPDSECLSPACPYIYLERVRLTRAQRRFAAAYAMSQFLPEFDIYSVGIAYVLERAHAAEGLAMWDDALQAYEHVLDSWKHADPEFQPYLADAAEGRRRVLAVGSRRKSGSAAGAAEPR